MNVFSIILISIILIILFGGAIFGAMMYIKKLEANAEDETTNPNITTAQEFIPFKDIKKGIIDLGDLEYRVILECSSLNYDLKTNAERASIEGSYQRFLNSLTFPISIFIQTRLIDNEKILKGIEKDLKKLPRENQKLIEYGNVFYSEMSQINNYTGNNKQKKKYIIIPYKIGEDLDELTEEEKKEYALKEIRQRALIIIDGLSAVGLKAKPLDTLELVELVYLTYNKDSSPENVNGIFNGDFTELLVKGRVNVEAKMTEDQRANWIITEAQNRLKNEILEGDTPDYIKAEYEKAFNELEKLKETLGINL